MMLLAVVLAASAVTALKGYAASVALFTYLSLGLVLFSRSSDFGLYKLYMYVQPFLAAAVAVWISVIARKRPLACVCVAPSSRPLATQLAAQVCEQQPRPSRPPQRIRQAPPACVP